MTTSTFRRAMAWKLIFIFLFGELAHWPLMAQNGPGAPEFQSFTPSEVTEMVNPFTGDFNYNIPLLDVGGYPINLSYSSGVGPEQDAGWVGLGWSLNAGSINRNVRGLPDDFNGDKITREVNMATDATFGARATISGELYGYELLQNLPLKVGNSLTMGFQHNNYMGWDYTVGASNSIGAALGNGDAKLSGSLALSSGYSKSGGNYLRPSAGLNFQMSNNQQQQGIGLSLGMSATSRKGMESLTFGVNFSKQWGDSHQSALRGVRVGGISGGPGHFSLGGSFPLHYSHPSYIPSFDLPRTSIAGTFSAKLGGELVGFAMAGELSGYFNLQKLKDNTQSRAAYGYVYAHEARGKEALMDVNREKDGPFHEKSPHLPLPIFTHDVYFATGQGYQGQFRPFRSDIGTLSDPAVNSDANAGAFGAEASFGNLVKAGADITITNTQSGSGKWQRGNAAASVFQFRGESPGNPLYEPVYFKRVGELTAMSNPAVFDRLGKFEPVYVPVSKLAATQSLRTGDESATLILNNTDEVLRQNREARFDLMSFLRADEAQQAGLLRSIHSTPGFILKDDIYNEYGIQRIPMPRIDAVRRAHHISEMSVTRSDGVRYVYGLPVYNTEKVEVSFNASGLTPDANGLVTYQPGEDNSTKNDRGINNYFSKTTTPPYASTYLLTAILSDDYVDLSGNGPTPDDLGNYTQFHYEKVHDQYGWRVPYGQNKAKFNEGHLATDDDDLASYVYGQKEIWYLKMVETKNYIAEFTFRNRSDVRNVIDENGNTNTSRLKYLKEIALYTRADIVKNGPASAVPIKRVHFEYNYTLCNGTPGGSSGKLTLRAVKFSYGKSNRSLYNGYAFTYNGNKPYAYRSSDRWGNYKAPTADNDLFPYTPLNKAQADNYAVSWHLSGITTPSKGRIVVHYESDDYAYVQDRRAMNMFEVAGFSDHLVANTTELDTRLYDDNGGGTDTPFDYLYFRMAEAVENTEEVQQYLDGITELYFRCRVEVSPSGGDQWEDIRGFIPLDNPEYGFLAGEPEIGWVRLPKYQADAEDMPNSSGSVHPITKAAAQQLAKEQPKVAYNLGGFTGDDFLKFLEVMSISIVGGAAANLIDFGNFIDEFRGARRGQQFDPNYAIVRLNNPTQYKYGGGTRVRRILHYDQWDTMSDMPNQDFFYGQEYDYTIEESGRTISSGVAGYEPLVGGDENPFVEPARYFVERKLAADVNEFAMLPLGESLYPGHGVGYRRVRVRNLEHADVNRTATGQVVHEFFTAKEFPTISRATKLDHYLEKPDFNPFQHKSSATVSQGFYIELNDMHGKPRTYMVYEQADLTSPISGVTYEYQTDPANRRRLSNTVPVINPETGATEDQIIGVEYELVMDARSSSTSSFSGGAQINVDVALLGPIPSVSVTGYPHIQLANIDYRGIVTTKLVQRAGILVRKKVFDNGSSLLSKNLVYDGQTGMPVITSMENEFSSPVFDAQLPAHWIYEGMGSAYRNAGLVLKDQTITNGELSMADPAQLFHPGDELFLRSLAAGDREAVTIDGTPGLDRPEPPRRGWVLRVNTNSIDVIDEAGLDYPNGQYDLKILRSGRRNMPATAVSRIQSLEDPVASGGLEFSEVLDAQALEYDDYWQAYLGFITEIPASNCSCTEARDATGKTIREAILDFISAELVFREWDEVTPEGIPLPAIHTFLPGTFNAASTVYYVAPQAAGLDITFQDTVRNETCALYLHARGEENFPTSFFLPSGESGTLFPLSTYACETDGKFEFTINWYDNQQQVKQNRVVAASDCIDMLFCTEGIEEFPPMTCGIEAGHTVNPYILGILGNWRPKTQQQFVTDRERAGRVATDGVYEHFSLFHTSLNGINLLPNLNQPDLGHWETIVRHAVIDPFGRELENWDALELPSATIFGYGFDLPIGLAQNAHYQQVAYDGFEDYEFANQALSPFDECDLPAHWRLDDLQGPVDETAPIARDRNESHTGHFSLRINNGEAAIARAGQGICDPLAKAPLDAALYKLADCDLIRTFSPTPGKYLLSAWVKEKPSTGGPVLDTAYEHSSINLAIQIGSTVQTESFTAAGRLVDGWQRIDGIFEIPAGAAVDEITVILSNEDAGWISYFDDIRIQPFNAFLTTYVYDPLSLRLVAILDERNQATFYEYDQQGQLIRTEKETEAGVLTIREARSSFAHLKNTAK